MQLHVPVYTSGRSGYGKMGYGSFRKVREIDHVIAHLVALLELILMNTITPLKDYFEQSY